MATWPKLKWDTEPTGPLKGIKVVDMATDDRENAADEVTYRLGRSFVIGAASTAAGDGCRRWRCAQSSVGSA